MPSKKKLWCWISLALAAVLLTAKDSPELRARKLQFMKAVYATYGFDKGLDARLCRETLGRYFTPPIYKLLRGNDLLGFQYDEGFSFTGRGFQLKEFKTTAGTARFGKPFLQAMQETVRQVGWTVTEAQPCQLGICLVAVVEEASPNSLAGVVLELYAKNSATGKRLFLRLKSGSKQGWQEAMKGVWRYICLILSASESHDR